MKRPLAYVTAAWRGGECEVMEQAAKYCRIVYDAGYSPICPMLYLPLFLNDAVPEEHKSGIDMGRDLLRRSRVLVAGFYAEGKPVHDKLNSIKFKKSREKYKAEQEHTLHFFYLARRELKPYLDGGGKLPLAQWEAERTRLKQEYAAESEAYKPILADLKSLRQIQYAVDSARHEQERNEQAQNRKYEQER